MIQELVPIKRKGLGEYGSDIVLKLSGKEEKEEPAKNFLTIENPANGAIMSQKMDIKELYYQ